MRIGFFQFSPVFGDKATNLNKITRVLSKVKADLIVLPELCNTGYSFLSRQELSDYAEKIPDGETTQTLLALAKKRKLYIVAGLAEYEVSRNKATPIEKNRVYNSAIFVSPNGKVAKYRKAHLFFEEKFIFNRGNTKFRIYPAPFGTRRTVDDIKQVQQQDTHTKRCGASQCCNVKIGIIICFDYIFPEASRSLALKGAQIICHPSNLILPYAQKVTVTRATENRVFFVMANRIGEEKRGKKHLKFNGCSQIINPSGEILARAGSNEEVVKIVKIDPNQALDKFVTRYNNVITDRRTDLYFR